jgi:beta-glucuronidase
MFPQQNAYHQYFDLSGFWDFRFDPEDQGLRRVGRMVSPAASWNDQLLEDGVRDNLGPAWYQVSFGLPWGFPGRQLSLRFGSVNYLADVWLNGVFLGRHEGGHMAFAFDASEQLRAEDNRLVVRVDGRLAPDRVPPGNLPREAHEGFAMHSYPDTSFDFFPYCGITPSGTLSSASARCCWSPRPKKLSTTLRLSPASKARMGC